MTRARESSPIFAADERSKVSWPGRDVATEFCRQVIWLSALWLLVYGGANWIASLHSYRVRLWTGAELAIPFVPAASIFYLSLFPMLWLSPFVLRDSADLRSFAKSISMTILVCGIGFIFLPSEPAYPLQPATGLEGRVFHFADAINLRYNMCPSLHVATAVAAACAYSLRSAAFKKTLWWIWTAAIAASTLLTHQHHLVDVVGGAVVGAVAARLQTKNAWPR